VLPVLGRELATARREAAKLRLENGRLKERVHKLEAKAFPRSSTAGSSRNGS
jgi:hypothetical protein